MSTKTSAVFEDPGGARLAVTLENLGDGRWQTYAIHSLSGRGATETHFSSRAAHQRWLAMERHVLSIGWPRRRTDQMDTRPPAAMRIVDGRRLFRDARTGEYFEDQSCSRPFASAPFSYYTSFSSTDAFSLENLPSPR